MAVEPVTNEGGAQQDVQTHVRDYSGFVRMLKWTAIIAFILTVLVVWLISN